MSSEHPLWQEIQHPLGGGMGGQIGSQIGGQIAELTERRRDALADKLSINASAVQKHLDKLKEAGAIERIGGTRGYWKVKI
ncbi:hypothetical protein ACU6RQ_08980 [Zobellella denitrificans]